jgi:hypothetical protein
MISEIAASVILVGIAAMICTAGVMIMSAAYLMCTLVYKMFTGERHT